MPPHRRCGLRSARVGLSLVESSVSIVLVGVAVVAALNIVGAAKFSQSKMSDRNRGYLAAQELLSEIMRQSYADAQAGPNSFGVEAGETTANRKDFDDVDDYHGLNESPPKTRDGTDIASLKHWLQTVQVSWVAGADLQTPVGFNQGYKRIVVTLRHDDLPAAVVVGVKSQGLPVLEACCRATTCDQLAPADCIAAGGSPKGANSNCWTADCSILDVLMVVANPAGLNSQEVLRQDLLKSWSFGVKLIDDDATRSEFDAALVGVQVAYVPVVADDALVSTKLASAAVGVVFEDPDLGDEFNICATWAAVDRTTLRLLNNTHYITSAFSLTNVTLFQSNQPVSIYRTGLALGAVQLGSFQDSGSTYTASLMVVNTGGVLNNLTLAPSRRVRLPWGRPGLDFSTLSSNGRTMLARSIVWAAGLEGDGAIQSLLRPVLDPLGV